MKKSLRKILTILLVATIIFTSNATMIFADGLNKQNELKNELGLDSNGGGSEINPTADETNLDNEENQEEDDEEKNLGNDENEAEEAKDDEATEATEDEELEMDEKIDEEPADTKDEKSNEEDKQDEEGLTSDDDTGNQSDDDIETKSEEDDIEIATSSEIELDDLDLSNSELEDKSKELFGADPSVNVKLTFYIDYSEDFFEQNKNEVRYLEILEDNEHNHLPLKTDKVTLCEYVDGEFKQYFESSDNYPLLSDLRYGLKDGVIYKFQGYSTKYVRKDTELSSRASLDYYSNTYESVFDAMVNNYYNGAWTIEDWLLAWYEETYGNELGIHICFDGQWEPIGTYEQITYIHKIGDDERNRISFTRVENNTYIRDYQSKVILGRYYGDTDEYVEENKDGFDLPVPGKISGNNVSYNFLGYKMDDSWWESQKLIESHMSYNDMLSSLKDENRASSDDLKTFLKTKHEENRANYPGWASYVGTKDQYSGGVDQISIYAFWGAKGYLNIDSNVPDGATFNGPTEVNYEFDIVCYQFKTTSNSNIEEYYQKDDASKRFGRNTGDTTTYSSEGFDLSDIYEGYPNVIDDDKIIYALNSQGVRKYNVESINYISGTLVGTKINKLVVSSGMTFVDRDDGGRQLNLKLKWKMPKTFTFEIANNTGATFKSNAKIQYYDDDNSITIPEYDISDGYKFSKWYYKNENTEVDITEEEISSKFSTWRQNTSSTANVIIYAKFVLKWQFKIELYPGDDEKGSITGTTTFNVGESFVLPSVQNNDGYVFINYYQDTDTVCNNVSQYFTNWNNNPTADKIVYARFANKRSITFEIDSTKGSTNATQLVFYNGQSSTLTIPIVQANDGYEFVSWTLNNVEKSQSDITNDFDSNWKKKVDATDLVYIAKFSVTSSFSFEIENNTGASFIAGEKTAYLKEDSLTELPKYEIENGYKFSKWYYKNGTDEVDITEAEILNKFASWKANTASTASVVIYAKFVLKWQFKIELYPGDDGKGSISGTTTFNVGDSFTLPSVQMNDGYVFINYYQDTNTVCNNVLQYFANWNSNPTEDKTVYARFYDKKSIKFEVDSTKGSTNDPIEFYNGYDSNIVIPNIKPAAGYKFVGWYIGDTKYEENNISSNFNDQWKRSYNADDISYTAKFEEAFSFSFNIDDEKGFTNDKIIFYDTDDNVNLPHITPKAGYRFANWTDKDGNVVSDTEFATRFTDWKNDSNKEDIEFTANFEVLKTFKIVYDDTKLKISNTATGKSSVDEDTKNDFPATVEALDSYFVGAAGYAFAGYSLTENGTHIDTQEVLDKFNSWSTNPNDDVVIYALYKVDITPKISFSVDSTKGTFNGDSEYTDQTSFDNAKSTFNIVAKDKYEFVDWKIDYYEISTEKITKTENKPMDYVKSMSFDSNYIITITANFKNKNGGGKNNNNNTSSRRGSSGGGGGGGGGSSGRIDNISVDPTININPDGPNPNNPNNPNTDGKISERNLMKNQNLELRLKSFSENSSSDVVSVKDVNSNVAYGKWYRIPSTTTWYFLTEDINQKVETASTGFLVNGWFNLPWDGIDKWYHFNDKGVMELGWFTDTDGKVYYLQHDFNDNWYGKKLTGVNIIDGVVYNFDENGALIQ